MSMTNLDAAHGPDASVLVALTRMEAKVDIALAQHGAEIKNQGEAVVDHEARIRALESRSTVSPRTLWTTVVTASGLIMGAAPFMARVLNH
jgi:hypothetical protein